MSAPGAPLVIGDAALPATTTDCGCCAGVAATTPIDLDNRPGLSAIAYRVGSHARFKASMVARLSAAELPALAGLGTRSDDDFSIALLDAWATVCDVLAFYQERIANEAYLPTATERLSIVELGRLIGYRPRPGVAAGTWLAFTLEAAAGAPEQAVAETTIARGTRVQSVPGPGETAQTFESTADLVARLAWNALKPRLSAPRLPVFGDRVAWLAGTGTNLRPGDAILLVGKEREDAPRDNHWDFRRLIEVEPDDLPERGRERTRIAWAEPLGSVTPRMLPAAEPKVHALRLRASLFGYNAPHPASLHRSIRKSYGIKGSQPGDWDFEISGQTIDLDNVYPGILRDSWLVLSKPTYQELYRASQVAEGARAQYAITGKTTRIVLDTDENLDLYDHSDYRATAVFAQSEQLEFAETPIVEPVWKDSIVLGGKAEDLPVGRVLIVRGRRARVEVAAGGLTLAPVADAAVTRPLKPGESLVLLGAPVEITGGGAPMTRWRLLDAGGFEGFVTTAADPAFAFVAADKIDEVVAEVATLEGLAEEDDTHTRLILAGPLLHAYDRGSAEILANVAPANSWRDGRRGAGQRPRRPRLRALRPAPEAPHLCQCRHRDRRRIDPRGPGR